MHISCKVLFLGTFSRYLYNLDWANFIKLILQEIYLSGKSQTEIGQQPGINQITISRLINPTNLSKCSDFFNFIEP